MISPTLVAKWKDGADCYRLIRLSSDYRGDTYVCEIEARDALGDTYWRREFTVEHGCSNNLKVLANGIKELGRGKDS